MENWIIFWMALAAIFALAIVGCIVERAWQWLFILPGPPPSVLREDGYFYEYIEEQQATREEFYAEAPERSGK